MDELNRALALHIFNNRDVYFTKTIPDMVERMGSCNLVVGSIHLVQVTHINSPHSFFVRLSCLRYSVKLLETPGSQLASDELEIGKVVVYRSNSTDTFIRGRIQAIFECERGQGIVCDIMALDYGCVDKHVLLKYICACKQGTDICGPLAIHCRLNTCEPITEAFDFATVCVMKYFVGNLTSKINIKFRSREKLKVDLTTLQCPDGISSILAVLNYTRFFRYGSRLPPVPNVPKYKHRELKPGDRLHIRVQKGTSTASFYAAEIHEYKQYDNVLQWYKFTQYCMNQPAADVEAAVDGRTCAVKVLSPERYERAIVLRVTEPNTRARVLLVDSGRETEANFEDIKVVGNEYNKCPVMALYCKSKYIFDIDIGLEFIIVISRNGNGFEVPYQVNLAPLLTRPVYLTRADYYYMNKHRNKI